MIVLKDIPLFSDLSDKYVEELQNHIQVRNYTKDSIVFYEGDESEYLHILIEGRVRIYKTTPKGRQIICIIFLHLISLRYMPLLKMFRCLQPVSFLQRDL